MMLTLAGYQILTQLYESMNSEVYRAVRESDHLPVILKVLKQDYPSPAELTRYQQEYELIHPLNLEGVIKVDGLEKYQNSLVLILEDFGGHSLRNWFEIQQVDLSEFLSIALKIVTSLGQIHAANIIHKDINPANIVFNRETGQLKIIDFGISTRLPREMPTLKAPNVLEGTLAYLSPEQTGRMNRSLDYRTDFYSLGVTFYELLTNQLPFAMEDDLELIHCHIAQLPVPPHAINPTIPRPLSEMVMKLMAKNAEDRYQSALGLKYDLEQILALQTSNLTGFQDLSGFQLAQQDISSKFLIPQKLYGREEVVAPLLTAFERVTQGPSQLLLVAGYSGIGKTAAVQEIYKPITQKRGYFIAGKFDQFQRNVPYSAVVQAFRDLMQQLLTEPQSRLDEWKTRILTAVGNNGQLIVNLLNEVELIIGAQPAVPMLPPTESQNRFNLVSQNFIKVFCQADHPLVIFLDDLQWIDSASLKLLTVMMSDIPYLLLIGAYRDNEVSPVHPLMTTVEEMQKQGLLVQTLTLSPLTSAHLNQLVSDTLHLPLADTAELTELVLEKTGGNPFFVGEFLKTLYSEQLLELDSQKHQWQWDLSHIKARNMTDNVVELMTGKIQNLSLNTQTLLKLGASIGSQFDLATLAVISQQSHESVKTALWEALQEGLVIPLSENYKFVHDRVQQAAYSLIPEAEKPTLHWQIGQLLLNNTQILEERLFEVVDHLNHGQHLATTSVEHMQLVQLNLRAGQKAKLAMAYPASLVYLQTAQIFLAKESWQTAYSLTLQLYTELHECLFLTTQFDPADAIFQQLQTAVQSPLELASVILTKIRQEAMQGHYAQSIQVGFDYCRKLGVELSEEDLEKTVQSALDKLPLLFAEHHLNHVLELQDLPELTSPEIIVSIGIMQTLLPVTFFYNPYLSNLLPLKTIHLAITSGITAKMAYSLACANLTFISLLNDYQSGYDYGRVGLGLAERFRDKWALGGIRHVFSLFILHWREPLQRSLPVAKEAFQYLVETGDLENAGYSFYQRLAALYETGENLQAVDDETQIALDFLDKTKNAHAWGSFIVYQQVVLLHQGQTSHTGSFDSPGFSEADYLQKVQTNGMALCYYRVYKLQLSYLFEDYESALKLAQEVEPILPYITGFWPVTVYNVYYSLTLCQLLTTEEKNGFAAKLRDNQKQLETWATLAPENFRHKFALIQAEHARINGDWRAVEFYEQAIQGAYKNGFLLDEALAYELAAQFYLAHEMEKVAQTYLQEAFYRYQRWGALAKIKQLEQKYPQFLTVSSIPARSKRATTTRFSTMIGHDSGAILDLATVIKANQVISGEIVLDKLLIALMKIIIQNAGAQIGYLILVNQGTLVITASGTLDAEQISGLQAIPVENCQMLSETIVNYVARTKTTVVLENATQQGQFTNDTYIKHHQPKSILCAPLINQGKLVSIVYLENNLTTGAFTAERVEILNILSAQAAISIKNAQLYHHTEALNRAYQRFVPRQFLYFLEKASIIDVELGDQVQLEMSVLFSDIRDFTTLSEKMTPKDNFQFINVYLSRMESAILENHGFIDKYIGDAIMALFSGSADDAVNAGLAMLQQLEIYNQERVTAGEIPIKIGIGINTGNLMLGTVGGRNRMDTTVISDAVNLAARVESLTKNYGVPLLITQHTYTRLLKLHDYVIRPIDTVKVKGKSELITVYAVFKPHCH